jgi:Na+-transporting NADH:ubiquinone oxidoreductase subunit B
MKFLFDFMDKNIAPLFEKGGKFERLYPLFEAGDTFHRTPGDVTPSAPHVRDSIDQKRLMIFVIYALIPCILFGIWNAGNQFNLANGIENTLTADLLRGSAMVLPIIFVSYLVGGLWEVLFALVRRHEINEGFLVTGMLFPLVLPPTLPLWQVAVGISFGIVIGKEIFGGVGYNILNPALTARAFLFFAYPAQISGDKVWVGSFSESPALLNTILGSVSDKVDVITQATPLAIAASAETGSDAVSVLNAAGFNLANMTLGTIPGCIGSTSVIAILLGALFLIITGIASWRIMLSGVIGCAAMGALFNVLPLDNPFAALPFVYHIVMGGFLFGIIFMATDPVSASATNAGKWIYGFLIGALTVLIRVANPAYPEGAMLAILFMNVMAPLIDHFVVQSHIKKRTAYARALNNA